MGQKWNSQTGKFEDDTADTYANAGQLALADTNTTAFDPSKPAGLPPEGGTIVPAAAPAPAPPRAPAATPLPGSAQPDPGAAPLTLTPPAGAPVKHLETDATSTTTSGISRKDKAAILSAEKDQEKALAEKESVARAQGEVAKADARDQETIAAESQQLAEQKAARQQQIIDQGDQAYQRAIKTYDDEYNKWKSMDIQDFYAGDKGKERALWSAMTVALGGLAQGQMARAQILSGGSPTAQNEGVALIDKRISDDYQRQKERIGKQFQVAEHSKEGIERSRLDQAHALNMLNMQTAAKYDAIAAKMGTMLAARGVSKADIATNETIAGLHQQSAALRQGTQQSVANHFQSTVSQKISEGDALGGAKGAKPTTEQLKNQDLVGRMISDEKLLRSTPPISQKGLRALQELQAKNAALDANPTMKYLATTTGQYKTPEQVLDDKDRIAYQAGNRFLASMLRGDSGAAISVGEYLTGAQQYLPTLGDKGQNVDTKQAARQKVIEGKLAGAANPQALAQEFNAPAAAAPSGGVDKQRIILAAQAIRDPNAPPQVKERARQILAASGLAQ